MLEAGGKKIIRLTHPPSLAMRALIRAETSLAAFCVLIQAATRLAAVCVLIRAATSLAAVCVLILSTGDPALCQTDQEPFWQSQLPGGSERFAAFLQAVSGKKNSLETRDLLRGVTAIKRGEDYFLLERADGAQLMLPRGSQFGDRMLHCMEKTERQARNALGQEAGDFVRSLSALTCSGDLIALEHAGKSDVYVPLPGANPLLPVSLKELHLSKISLHLDDSGRTPKLKNMQGIAAVVNTGALPIAVEPREFCRWRDTAGNTRVDFGIQNPVLGAMRFFLHLPAVLHFRFTIKRK